MTEEGTLDKRLAEQVRMDVRGWLSGHWLPGKDHTQFLEEALDAGWLQPAWPLDMFGRGLPEEATPIVEEAFREIRAPLPEPTVQHTVALVVLRDFAESPELRGPVLRKLLTSEYRPCLLYSEPGADTDLAAVQTRAERDGDEWVINGQKVWTTDARQATHGLLVARTNWDVPKRRGITYFMLPMQQEGVDVRPIKQMNGRAEFNEVFLTDVRVPDFMRIGPVEDGWRILQTGLAVERMFIGVPTTTSLPDLVAVARETGHNSDPIMRQEIARLHALQRIRAWSAERASGEADMSTATVLKLANTTVLYGSARIHAQLIGQDALLIAGGSAAGGTGQPRSHDAVRPVDRRRQRRDTAQLDRRTGPRPSA